MIIALSGPSGIGKGYFKEAILSKYPNVQELIWYTTRGLRPNEFNRKSISESEFEVLLNEGKMALVQDMFGHRYGISHDDLLKESGEWLTEVHPYILEEAKHINPHIITIGMITEDFSLLRERLAVKRKTENPAEIEARLGVAEKEMAIVKASPELFDEVIVVTRENESSIANIAQEIFKKYWKEGEQCGKKS